MERGATGQYETTVAAGERVRAFVPAPLPPRPRLDLRGPLERRLESASLALGRLDSVSDVLAHANNLVYSYVRKEAVLSSQIEGSRSSLSDLLFFERGGAVRFSRDDVEEVATSVAATDHGLRRLAGGLPLSNRLIREVHGVLFSHERGAGATPGGTGRRGWRSSSKEWNRVFRHDQERIDAEAGRKASSARRVHGALQARVVVSLGEAARRTGLTFQTVSRAMDLLVDYGIAREVTGGSRNRLYAYREYLAVLDRGVEGPPG